MGLQVLRQWDILGTGLIQPRKLGFTLGGLGRQEHGVPPCSPDPALQVQEIERGSQGQGTTEVSQVLCWHLGLCSGAGPGAQHPGELVGQWGAVR